MTHVQECIELYVADDDVTDAQFRAILLDALARDVMEDVLAATAGPVMVERINGYSVRV